jgi:hypothetical protein
MNNIPLPGGLLLIIIALYYGFYVNKKAREKRKERREQLNETRKAYLENIIESKNKTDIINSQEYPNKEDEKNFP